MPDTETLDERLRAVERALTGDDRDLTDLRASADLARELEALDDRLGDAEERLDDLDAATQALRGYVGNVRAVNESVERRADAALAKAESVDREPRPAERGVCDCERRRADPPDETSEETDDDPGALARLAATLR